MPTNQEREAREVKLKAAFNDARGIPGEFESVAASLLSTVDCYASGKVTTENQNYFYPAVSKQIKKIVTKFSDHPDAGPFLSATVEKLPIGMVIEMLDTFLGDVPEKAEIRNTFAKRLFFEALKSSTNPDDKDFHKQLYTQSNLFFDALSCAVPGSAVHHGALVHSIDLLPYLIHHRLAIMEFAGVDDDYPGYHVHDLAQEISRIDDPVMFGQFVGKMRHLQENLGKMMIGQMEGMKPARVVKTKKKPAEEAGPTPDSEPS